MDIPLFHSQSRQEITLVRRLIERVLCNSSVNGNSASFDPRYRYPSPSSRNVSYSTATLSKHTLLTKVINLPNMSRSILNIILLLASITLISALSLDTVLTNVSAGSDFTLHIHNDLSYGSGSFDRHYDTYTVYLRLFPVSYEDASEPACSLTLVDVPINTTSVSQPLNTVSFCGSFRTNAKSSSPSKFPRPSAPMGLATNGPSSQSLQTLLETTPRSLFTAHYSYLSMVPATGLTSSLPATM